MLLAYTAFFSFPFLIFLFFVFSYSLRFSLFISFFSDWNLPDFLLFIVFLGFSVKLPIYGLHFWLPMAHVEAPTFGSIILAGVLLKLGGVGLLRLSLFFSFELILCTFLSYSIFFLSFVTLVCCYQSDFKRLVAFSSVSHIIAIPLLFFANTSFSLKSLSLVLFFHGLSSPLMFMLVGICYSVFSSRQLVALRGLVLFSPLVTLFSLLSFFFTLSAPPFPSFVREVFFFVGSLGLTPFLILSLVVFAFFSLLYNLN
jgi:NADH:ubiquinone oxidoreductase subunit 4 (subunit M)